MHVPIVAKGITSVKPVNFGEKTRGFLTTRITFAKKNHYK